MTKPLYLVMAVTATVLFYASAEEIKFDPCDEESQKMCKISHVSVDPCPEAAKNEPCRLKRGKPATITYNYNPEWTKGDGKLKSRAYWVSVLDLPFVGMDTDACKYTTCPIVKGKDNFYNYTLDISKTFLAQRYDVKFKLWEDEAPERKECCFIFKMKLV